jgi:hypothetical protein
MTAAVCFAPPALLMGLLAPSLLDEACRTLQSAGAGAADTPFAAYVLVFLVNCLLETPAYAIAGRWLGRSPQSVLGQILGLNFATHPAVYFILPALAEKQGWTAFTQMGVSEAFAFGAEALLLRAAWHYSWRWAVAASALANLSSWWIGAHLSDSGLLP